MCTFTVAQYILNALTARIKDLSVFTAKDITDDARKETDENVKHQDVRRIVHEEFNTNQFPPEYNQEEFLELKNGQTAICYYPDGKSAFDHPKAVGSVPVNQGYARNDKVVTPPVAGNSTTHVVSVPLKKGGSVKDGSGFICSKTSKGVINIPDAIVKGVTPNGGTYDISVGGDVIYKTPDGQGRLRIASSKLGLGSKFRLEVVNNTITVEQM